MTIQVPQIESQVVFREKGAGLTDISTSTWEACAVGLVQAKKLHFSYKVHTGETRTLQYDLTQKHGCCSVSYLFHYKGSLEEVNERDYKVDAENIEVGLNRSLKDAISSSRKLKNDLAMVSFETSDNWLADNRPSDTQPLLQQ
ncbi:hypothetical protein [Parashewanella tropica]|uniref:hypothetical protein n=1 Tax=Parashewanella tropica TaxID=2547970 RepID=UPI001059E6B3|nr:hypothetical protein [Parashewanella tropica]